METFSPKRCKNIICFYYNQIFTILYVLFWELNQEKKFNAVPLIKLK